MTIPLAVVAGLSPLAIDVGMHWKNDGPLVALNELGHGTTGITVDSSGAIHFDPVHAITTLYLPLMVGAFGHKLAGKMGINRMIAKAGIPILRI